jgi:hypothetical protein
MQDEGEEETNSLKREDVCSPKSRYLAIGPQGVTTINSDNFAVRRT